MKTCGAAFDDIAEYGGEETRGRGITRNVGCILDRQRRLWSVLCAIKEFMTIYSGTLATWML